MRCHICNEVLDEVEVDPRDGKVCPCPECQSHVDDVILDTEILDLDELFIDEDFD